MGTVRLGVFPSLNNKIMQDQISKGITKFFLDKFPPLFFSHVYLDSQLGNSNMYSVNEKNEFIPIQSGEKIRQPNLRVTITQGGNNMSELFGTDIWNVNQQPGAFQIDTNLTGYRPIIYDPFGGIISLNERQIRNSVDMIVRVNTKADQLAFCNICDSNIQMNFVTIAFIETVIPIPQLLLEYYRSCLFKPEILALDRMKDDSDDKTKYKQQINKQFTEFLYKFSECHIKPYREFKDKSFSYGYHQIQRVTFRLNKYDADNGNKKGNVWENFNINLNGYIEYSNPISFMTSIPAIIRGQKNNWYIKSSASRDKLNYYHTIQFKEVFKDNRSIVNVDADLYIHFYLEKEILMSQIIERFNILDDIIDVDDNPTHYYIIKILLQMIDSQEEFDKLFLVRIYKDEYLLDKTQYTIDKEFNFIINNCSLTDPYYIDIFVNRDLYFRLLNGIKQKLIDLGVVFDENESNIHSYNKKSYKNRKLYNKSHPGWGKHYEIEKDGDFINNAEKRGLGYVPKLETGLNDRTGKECEFLPIKAIDFLVIDPEFDYYVLDNDKYIKVDDRSLMTKKNNKYFIKIEENYVEIDVNKVIIPDPYYLYYTYDRNEKIFKFCENLENFNILTQYYIERSQYRMGYIHTENNFKM